MISNTRTVLVAILVSTFLGASAIIACAACPPFSLAREIACPNPEEYNTCNKFGASAAQCNGKTGIVKEDGDWHSETYTPGVLDEYTYYTIPGTTENEALCRTEYECELTGVPATCHDKEMSASEIMRVEYQELKCESE